MHEVKRFLLALLGALLLSGIPAAASSLATTTILAVASGGSGVTTVTLGSVVTLTATVKTGNAAMTVGQVNFCDSTAAHCTDIHLLNTAQLTKAGTASFIFRPSAGTHSYKAVFVGTNQAASSTSSTQVLKVTGSSWSVTQFPTPSNADNNGNLTLTATVLGGGSTAPTGTVSFLNTSEGNAVLGTASLVAGTPGALFPSGSQAFSDYYDGLGHSPTSVAVGDFNGDGFLDVAVADGNDVTIYLGDANGNLTSGQVNPNAGTSVVVGDFNGDGILDLVSGKSVFLGKGDGSFTPGSILPASSSILASTDFNGDGVLDLVSGTAVYLGNGDGTFKAGVDLPTSGDFVAVSDFNGDGIPDLAISNISGESVTVLPGKGDGSFAAGATNYTSLQKGSLPGPVAGADLTGDGFQDLVIANNDGTITLQLNDGKGNFTLVPNSAQINICPGRWSTHPCYGAGSGGIQVADINGDGIPDLVVGIPFAGGQTPSGYAWVLLGNGKGDFPTSVATGGAPEGMAIGDFNGDGIPDVVVASPGETHAEYVYVSFAANQAATATATGVKLAPATGWQLVVASYPGDSNYKGSISAPDSLQPPTPPSTLLTPKVVVTATANTAVFGTSVTFWVTVSGSGPTPTGSVVLNGSALLDSKGVAGGFL